MSVGLWTNNVLELDKFWGTVGERTPTYSKEEVLAKRLACASCSGKVSDVAILLKASANVNWADHPSNQTPLLLAAAWGHEEICKMLLDAGADTQVRHEIFNKSPLEYTQIKNGTTEKIETYKRISLLLTAAQENRIKSANNKECISKSSL